MFGSQWVYCDQIKIKKEMKNKQYWKGKWDSCTKKIANCFLPQIFFIVQRKRKCQEDETSEKFTSMSCFLHALSTTKASRKSIFIFFSSLFFSSFFHFPFSKIHYFFFFSSLSSWLPYAVLHFPTVTFPSQMASNSQGGPGREQACQVCPPASCMHMDWEVDLIPPSIASLFVLTNIPHPGSAFHK